MSYTDANGIQHNSYSEACQYYGADTPESLEQEGRYYEQLSLIAQQDDMEARNGPKPRALIGWLDCDDAEIPF